MKSLLCATGILLAAATPAVYATPGGSLAMSEVSELRSDEDSYSSDVTGTDKPTDKPTVKPTDKPTVKPTDKPTAKPTDKPTAKPTDKPTAKPTVKPTAKPVLPPKVSIHGGDRTVPAAGFSASVAIVDPSLGRKPVDYNQVAWTCKNNCPAPLDSLPNGKSFKVSNVPAGTYVISATYKDTVVDSVTFTVTEDPVMFVSIASKFEKPQLTTEPMRVLCVYKAPKTGTVAPVKVSWETNGKAIEGADSKVLNLTPTQLTAFTKDGELPLKCTVTDGTTTGSSSKTVRMIQPLTKMGTCSIAHRDGSTGPFVSGESKLTISTADWDNDALSFKFIGPRTSIKSETAEASLPCPFSKTGKVEFKVAAIQEGQIVGETECEIDVTMPADLKAVAEERVNEMEEAAASGNTQAVLEAALAATSASAQNDASDEATAKDVRTKTIAAMSQAFGGENGEMTKDQRAATVEVMKSLIRKPADSKQSSAPELSKDEKKQMRKVLRNVLEANAADVDTKTQGADLLDLFTSAASEGKELKEDTRDLAGMAAENLQPGETQAIVNDEVAIFAEKRSGADAVEQPVEAEATTVKLNDDLLDKLSVGPEGELATSCVEFSGSTVAVPSDRKMTSKQTEFDVQVDGERKAVKGLTDPIKITMKSQGADATEKMKTAKCMFFDTDKNKWDTEGVTNGAKNGPQAEVECKSVHLSMFGLLSEGGSTGANSVSSVSEVNIASSGSATHMASSATSTSVTDANLYTPSGAASYTVGAAFAMVLALVF